jgi:hypothetical protein
VPNVTMNGGNLILVTSRPLIVPHSNATRAPTIKAIGPGQPLSETSFAMTSEDSTITAPIDRSIPR